VPEAEPSFCRAWQAHHTFLRAPPPFSSGNPRHLLVGLGAYIPAYAAQGAEQLLPKNRLSPDV
jgi:hypothetical protein